MMIQCIFHLSDSSLRVTYLTTIILYLDEGKVWQIWWIMARLSTKTIQYFSFYISTFIKLLRNLYGITLYQNFFCVCITLCTTLYYFSIHVGHKYISHIYRTAGPFGGGGGGGILANRLWFAKLKPCKSVLTIKNGWSIN